MIQFPGIRLDKKLGLNLCLPALITNKLSMNQKEKAIDGFTDHDKLQREKKQWMNLLIMENP